MLYISSENAPWSIGLWERIEEIVKACSSFYSSNVFFSSFSGMINPKQYTDKMKHTAQLMWEFQLE